MTKITGVWRQVGAGVLALAVGAAGWQFQGNPEAERSKSHNAKSDFAKWADGVNTRACAAYQAGEMPVGWQPPAGACPHRSLATVIATIPHNEDQRAPGLQQRQQLPEPGTELGTQSPSSSETSITPPHGHEVQMANTRQRLDKFAVDAASPDLGVAVNALNGAYGLVLGQDEGAFPTPVVRDPNVSDVLLRNSFGMTSDQFVRYFDSMVVRYAQEIEHKIGPLIGQGQGADHLSKAQRCQLSADLNSLNGTLAIRQKIHHQTIHNDNAELRASMVAEVHLMLDRIALVNKAAANDGRCGGLQPVVPGRS